MAGDPFRLLVAGEQLDSGVGPFNLTWHNEMTEAWRHFKRAVPSVSAEPAEVPSQDDFLIANVSGAAIPRYGIVGYIQDDFCVLNDNQVAIYSADPASDAPFAVTLDPIPASPCFIGLGISSSVDPPNAAVWGKVLGPPDPQLWDSAESYVAGNLVYTPSDLIVYWCTAPNTNHSPPNASYWRPIGSSANRLMYRRGVAYGLGDVVFLPAVGRAKLDGAVRCTVDLVQRSHSFAAPIDGDYTKLLSQSNLGPAEILVRQAGTGNITAIVRMCCCADVLTGPGVSHTTDCFLGPPPTTPPQPWHTTDAYLVRRLTRLHSTDAYLVLRSAPYHTTDCFVLRTFSPHHTTDAFLLWTASHWHRTDCFLKPTGLWHATDAYLVTRVSLTHTTDCVLRPAHGVLHSTDCYTIVRGAPHHRTDCFLAPSGLWHATDAFLAGRDSIHHRTDCFLKPVSGLWHATDCLVAGRISRHHTTDCYLFNPLSPLHATDCFLAPNPPTPGHWHATDAYLIGSPEPNHRTDCFVGPFARPWHSTDTRLISAGPHHGTISTDCCPDNLLPSTLYAHVTVSTNGATTPTPCLTGTFTVTLNYGSVTLPVSGTWTGWIGSVTCTCTDGSGTATVYFILPNDALCWEFVVECVTVPPNTNGTTDATSWFRGGADSFTCSPFSIEYSDTVVTSGTICMSSSPVSMAITVTE